MNTTEVLKVVQKGFYYEIIKSDKIITIKVKNCGKFNRDILIDSNTPNIIKIGCSYYTKEEAIKSILNKYKDTKEATEYIDKVKFCFKLARKHFNTNIYLQWFYKSITLILLFCFYIPVLIALLLYIFDTSSKVDLLNNKVKQEKIKYNNKLEMLKTELNNTCTKYTKEVIMYSNEYKHFKEEVYKRLLNQAISNKAYYCAEQQVNTNIINKFKDK